MCDEDGCWRVMSSVVVVVEACDVRGLRLRRDEWVLDRIGSSVTAVSVFKSKLLVASRRVVLFFFGYYI